MIQNSPLCTRQSLLLDDLGGRYQLKDVINLNHEYNEKLETIMRLVPILVRDLFVVKLFMLYNAKNFFFRIKIAQTRTIIPRIKQMCHKP